MEVILLEKVTNLGIFGDKVSVKNGYARNYLIPQGKATAATAKKIAEFEARRAELENIGLEKFQAAQARGERLAKLEISIAHKAGEEGRLFGSVGAHDIAEAITATGLEIGKHEIRMPHGAIRHIGDYDVDIALHTDVVITLSIKVVAEG